MKMLLLLMTSPDFCVRLSYMFMVSVLHNILGFFKDLVFNSHSVQSMFQC